MTHLEHLLGSTRARRRGQPYYLIALLAAGSGTPAAGQWTVVSLHPSGAAWSQGSAVSAGQQVGLAYVGTAGHAALWSATAASWIDLHPAGAEWSFALGADGAQQTGYIIVGVATHASL